MFLFQAEVVTNSPDVVAEVVKVGNATADYVNQINWSAPSWDLFIVLFFVVTVFLYGLSLGRDRIVVILVSIYMALAVVSNAPFIDQLRFSRAGGQIAAFRIGAFVGIFVLLFFLLSRSVLLKTFSNLASGKWWQVLAFSILHVGLLVSITLSLLPADAVSHLAPFTRSLFLSDGGKFIWIVAPIMAMVTLKGD
ncbi:MAG: hypothetical protein WCT10_00550 [Patescibacteria group bacterium]|jgi:hypothetical protein